ncbi:hypothetical protein EOPP23_01775 [Endozoicomonas sp. OPT23]|uniref:DedA family protein n=1 Tax=Endozoicomonas sp. OPT23 TaxID=2072845 RepID=UPI00129B93A2|nr:VTT domain-containing protein [Endozoicomonas sp. OPT23]MRI31724.1 hypothetical protein [Endozoicomonas sp. OPT23]
MTGFLMFEDLLASIQHPLVLALMLLLGTYLLEDAAIITGALLSADGLISSELAFIALFIGIFTGDLGLYGLGVFLTRVVWLQRFFDLNAVNNAGIWLRKRMTFTVLFVRIIPGLRLPVYTACGSFRLSFIRFAILVLFASLVWTGFIFFGLYSLGSMFWEQMGLWKWLLLPLLIFVFLQAHKLIGRYKAVLDE